MPYRLSFKLLGVLLFASIVLAFVCAALVFTLYRQQVAYRRLEAKHDATMTALSGLEKLAIEQQYQAAEDLFLVNIKTAATQREKIRADAEYRAFKGKYPNASVYDRELRHLRQHRRTDRVPSTSQQ